MENVGLKRKSDDEIARDFRRKRFMEMEAKNKLRKLNNESSSFNENPIISDDNSSHSHEELDLNLSLAPPGQCSNTNNNSISSASSYITSIVPCARDTLSKNSRVKKPRKSTSSVVPVAVPAVAVVGANDGVDWQIKKQLSESDVTGRQNRLFVEKRNMSYIMNKLNDEEQKTVSEGGGFQIPVVDTDTGELKRLKFSFWKSTKSYILNGEWQTKFVDQRGLKEKDVVGLRWDDTVENCDRRLIFSVLGRATPSNPNVSSQEINTPSNSNESSQEINTSSNPNESSQ